MNKKKLICTVLSIATAASYIPNVFADTLKDDTNKAVYSVTFDDGSSKYELKDGASLVESDYGKAVKLDGTQKQYVQLENNITENLSGDYTISADVYPEDNASFARVFDIGSGTDNFMYFTTYGGGIPKFRFKNDDLFSYNVFFNLNEWNNVTITKEGSDARLYINGQIAATSDTFVNDLSLLGKTDKNYLGKSQYEADAYFTGMIDNFNIYNYAISEKDIKSSQGISEVKATVGYKSNGNEIAYISDNMESYAEIINYSNDDVTAKTVNIGYDKDGNVSFTKDSDTVTVKKGETSSIKVSLLSDNVYKIKTYLYTSKGGFEKMTSVAEGLITANPLPEDTMDNTVGVHDPSIFKDPQSGTYYVYSTGMLDIYKSEDLMTWTKTVNTLPEVPQCVYDNYKHDNKSEYSNIWAPDMFYDESDKETPYHLTCSYSDAFGKNNSSIILFKSASPEGPWENGEIIFTSKTNDSELGKVNAIDSNICVDHETGQKYMVYGSFWQGIHIKELNDDGTLKDPETVGTRIMSRYRGIGGPEGPYIIYNEDTGYYYLFTSYDSLSDTYQIRVARSKNITGPYVDQNGNNVDRFDDDESESGNTYGYKLIGSYQFPFGTNYYGPGHNSVLNDDGKWYLVHHVRTVKNGYATLNVRPIIWNEDGWPMTTPERYQGDNNSSFDSSNIAGQWDFISIGDNTNALLSSSKLTLDSDKTAVLGDITGTWEYDSGKLVITLGDEVITAYVSAAYDSDNGYSTLQFTGTNQNNITKWGKKAITTKTY